MIHIIASLRQDLESDLDLFDASVTIPYLVPDRTLSKQLGRSSASRKEAVREAVERECLE